MKQEGKTNHTRYSIIKQRTFCLCVRIFAPGDIGLLGTRVRGLIKQRRVPNKPGLKHNEKYYITYFVKLTICDFFFLIYFSYFVSLEVLQVKSKLSFSFLTIFKQCIIFFFLISIKLLFLLQWKLMFYLKKQFCVKPIHIIMEAK